MSLTLATTVPRGKWQTAVRGVFVGIFMISLWPATRFCRRCYAIPRIIKVASATISMLAPSLLLAATGGIAVTGFLAKGMLAKTGARSRAGGRSAMASACDSPPAVMQYETPASTQSAERDERKDRALHLLDRWSAVPRSVWHAAGDHRAVGECHSASPPASADKALACAVELHADPFDAWIVLDAAETAWFLAPEDCSRCATDIEYAARSSVSSAALAMLVRPWLSDADFACLMARVAAHGATKTA
jgi:hypothetical protein